MFWLLDRANTGDLLKFDHQLPPCALHRTSLPHNEGGAGFARHTLRVVDGKVVEVWNGVDCLKTFQQMEAVVTAGGEYFGPICVKTRHADPFCFLQALPIHLKHRFAPIHRPAVRQSYPLTVALPKVPVTFRSNHFGVARPARMVAWLMMPGTLITSPFMQAL